MKYLLGIDFGGGASKATLIDTNGNIIADNTVEYPTLYPENGACEQNPQDWLNALCENSKALLSKSGIRAKLIKVDSSKTAHGCNYGIDIDKADFYNTAMVLRSEGINYEVYKD